MSRFIPPYADVGKGITPSSGAKYFFFESNTSTRKNTYSDEALTTPNTNPVIADSNGLFPDIWLEPGQYKVRLTDKNDVQKHPDADPVESSAQAAETISVVDTISLLRSFEPLEDGQQISLLGHTLPGIGGGEFYYDASDTTSADNNGTIIVTTGDKRWKRQKNKNITPEMFGALSSTDSFQGIQDAFNYVSGTDFTTVTFDSKLSTSQKIIIPTDVGINMLSGSIITATSAMDAVFETANGVCSRIEYKLAKVDCAGLADTPLFIRNGQDCDIESDDIIAPRLYGLLLGDPTLDGAFGKSYGHHIARYRATRQLGATSNPGDGNPKENSGTIGLWEQSVTDVKVSQMEMVGFDIGHVGAGTGFYYSFHCWASQDANSMDVAFKPGGDSRYIACYADKPQSYGWDIEADKFRVSLVGCVHFNSPNGGAAIDPISVNIAPAVGAFSCYGLSCKGGAQGILQDFSITTSQLRNSQFDIRGTSYENVTNRLAEIPEVSKSERFELYDNNKSRVMIISDSGSETTFFSDTSSSNVLSITSNGATLGKTPSDKTSFFGATPVIQPAAPVDLADVIAALKTLGLVAN